jgi:hypothetical protein
MLFAVLCYEDNAVDRVRVWGERRQDQEALRHVEISSMAAVVGKAWRRATEEVANGGGPVTKLILSGERPGRERGCGW